MTTGWCRLDAALGDLRPAAAARAGRHPPAEGQGGRHPQDPGDHLDLEYLG